MKEIVVVGITKKKAPEVLAVVVFVAYEVVCRQPQALPEFGLIFFLVRYYSFIYFIYAGALYYGVISDEHARRTPIEQSEKLGTGK